MPIFRVDCEITLRGHIDVEADKAEEAVAKVEAAEGFECIQDNDSIVDDTPDVDGVRQLGDDEEPDAHYWRNPRKVKKDANPTA